METKNIEKDLDAILQHLKENPLASISQFCIDNIKPQLNGVDIDEYIEELSVKEFIRRGEDHKKNLAYNITVKGRLFEGYEQNKINQDAINLRIKKIEEAQKKYQCWMIVLTVILSIGTLIADWYYLIEICK